MAAKAGKEWVYYTYRLIDPRDNSVFYVGKGKGNRMFAHQKECERGAVTNHLKFDRIKSILSDGFEVVPQKIACFMDEADAYSHEAAMIAEYGDLTNLTLGFVDDQAKATSMAEAALDRVMPFDEWVVLHKPTASHALMYWRIIGELVDMANGVFSIRREFAQ